MTVSNIYDGAFSGNSFRKSYLIDVSEDPNAAIIYLLKSAMETLEQCVKSARS